ncbi:phage tail protein [bacterium AM6]|nr:phage tail protein [bacterium AM6]
MKREFVTGAVDKLLSQFKGNDSGNAPVLLMLGGFKFSLNTAVFQQIQQSTISAGRPGSHRPDACTAVHRPGSATMTLPGVVYPLFRGAGNEMSQLRKLASQGKPQRLLTGKGGNLGLWVIEKIDVTSSEFTVDSQIQKQDFTLTLRKHSDGTNV